MNKTKIVASISNRTNSKETLRDLINTGVDIVRINLNYADYDFCTDVINTINELNAELKTTIGTMISIRGPLIKTRRFMNGGVLLKLNSEVKLCIEDILGNDKLVSIDYSDLVKDVQIGTIIKLNSGKVELEVADKEKGQLICNVLKEGIVVDNSNVNILDSRLNIPYLNKDDIEMIKYADKMNIDYICLPYVSSELDVLKVNRLLLNLNNTHIGLISRIENEKGLNFIDDILKISEGIMISRSDMGVEIGLEKIPMIQKDIISKCHDAGKICIVGTELLSSMESSPEPTTAEVNDVINAVNDGVDALMLTTETTIGNYPIETVEMMEKIIETAESNIDYNDFLNKSLQNEKEDITGMIAYSVTECANKLGCVAIVTPTMSGYTARKISRFRPSCPIIVLSPNLDTVKSMTIYYGTNTVQTDEFNSLEEVINKAKKILIQKKYVNMGDKIIITGGYPFKNSSHTNFMKIEEI